MLASFKYFVFSVTISLNLVYFFIPIHKSFNLQGYFFKTLNDSLPDSSSIRIVCLVTTQIKNHKTRVQAIKETWGRKCKALVFLTNSTVNMSDVSVANINRLDTYGTLWYKTKVGFTYVWEKYKNDGDWFLKADDDSFIVMENLKQMLVEKKVHPDDPVWFGNHFRVLVKKGFMSGSAYLLSREATRRLVLRGLKVSDQSLCKTNEHSGSEDAEMGKCMFSLGVNPGDSRDAYLKPRMFALNAETVLKPGRPYREFWFFRYIKYPHSFGHPGCCSDTPIHFHYVSYENLYLYNYLMYTASVHGENNGYRAPPDPKTLVQNMKIDWKYIWS